MGMQGPLTAQALGRSPYDDVVEWDGDQDDKENDGAAQQYDHRGRPMNPETKRINRDIIRSHNEVMLVIGVAEQENPSTNPEVDAERRHTTHEDNLGVTTAFAALRCVDAIGAFGVDGLRQRILIYKRYSHVSFWGLCQQARTDFSFSRDVMTGTATTLIANHVDRQLSLLWRDRPDRIFTRRLWLPGFSFFIPFTQESPIFAPPPLTSLSVQSLLQWAGGVCICATPFLCWIMTQRMVRDWRPQVWAHIYKKLPSTGFPPGTVPTYGPPDRISHRTEQSSHDRTVTEDVSPIRAVDGQLPDDPGPVEAVRRPSTFSARGDDYASDEDENEGLGATLISFDVEATEASDSAPAGLWSAELRPSIADTRGAAGPLTTFCDTMLTQLPPLIASHVLADAVVRLLATPYEAMALRLVARTFRARLGLPCYDICSISILSDLTVTSITNFLGSQLLHLAICGEVWACFTMLSQVLHQSPEEWREAEERKMVGWSDE
ncbi:hypothetical protein FZEAL_3139 [Fusarium zealandicum]|uniref:Uncharacterized protein n=1 Tax=Fusarium zealandicum TaxID=1053134 RepID=A0A8H4UPW5_9HYPO|nr:hypothetical protein FZEAL_3139 [Fusarium zealandicum]